MRLVMFVFIQADHSKVWIIGLMLTWRNLSKGAVQSLTSTCVAYDFYQ